MQEMQVQSLGQEDLLEKEMATHASILAWRIPWTEKPGGLQSMRLQRVGHDWATEHACLKKKKWKKRKGRKKTRRKQTGRKKEKDEERKKGERERGRTGRKKENGQLRPISLGTYISNKNLHRRKNIHNAWYYGLAFHVQRKLRSSVNPSLAKRKITLKLIHVTWTQVETPGSYPNFIHLAN